MDALHEEEGEGGRVEEVDADAHVAARTVHNKHLCNYNDQVHDNSFRKYGTNQG